VPRRVRGRTAAHKSITKPRAQPPCIHHHSYKLTTSTTHRGMCHAILKNEHLRCHESNAQTSHYSHISIRRLWHVALELLLLTTHASDHAIRDSNQQQYSVIRQWGGTASCGGGVPTTLRLLAAVMPAKQCVTTWSRRQHGGSVGTFLWKKAAMCDAAMLGGRNDMARLMTMRCQLMYLSASPASTTACTNSVVKRYSTLNAYLWARDTFSERLG
jgi:hypothetical protein